MNVHRLDSTELLRNIAHALRTPIGSIFNLTDLMQLGLEGELDAQAHTAVLSIHQDAHQLHHTLEAIFDLIQADTVILNAAAIDLAALVSKAAETLKEAASRVGKTLMISTTGAVPPVHADAEATHEVLLKLLGHVIQFTAQDMIVIGLEMEPDRVVVSIGDCSITMADSPCSLPDSQLKDELSIDLLFCLHTIERQGGTLWASHGMTGNFILNFSLPLTASQNTPKK